MARALLREGETIYAALEDLERVAARADELQRRRPAGDEDDELPSEQNWAQCDSCHKWRRLGPQQARSPSAARDRAFARVGVGVFGLYAVDRCGKG